MTAPEVDAARDRQLALRVAAVSHRGLVRERNEDAFAVPGYTLIGGEADVLSLEYALDRTLDFVVADGMGGHVGGAEASRLALDAFAAADGDLGARVSAASAAVNALASDVRGLAGMATTIVGLHFDGKRQGAVFNAGDSRCYQYSEGYLIQLSEEDRNAAAGTVTRYLGGGSDANADAHVREFPVVPGDRFLLCTDGLTEVASDDDIKASMQLDETACAERLLATVLDGGAPDNVTLVVVSVVDVPESGG